MARYIARPEYFAMVMATGIVAAGLRLEGWRAASAALVAIAAAVWAAAVAACVVQLAVRRARIGEPATAAFGWYAVVAACVVLGSGLGTLGFADLAAALAAAALAAWLAGTWLIPARLVSAGLRQRPAPAIPDGVNGTCVLAAVSVLGLPRTSAVTAVGPAVTDIALALWYLASGLYPVLAALTALWWLRSGRPLRYQPTTWVIIFPLGMYAVASWRLGGAAGLPFVHGVGSVTVWPAALAWILTAAALALPAARRLGRAVQPARPQPNGSGGSRRYTFQAVVTIPAAADGDGALGPDWHGVIRAGTSTGRSGGLFSALVSHWERRDGDSAGSASAVATIVAFGPEPADCLPAGEPFVLWRGQDVGHGVVTRRVFV